MRLKVKQWGDSAAIRIPERMLDATSLLIGQQVTIRAEGGAIIIEPVRKPIYHLDDLLAGIKPDTFHAYVNYHSPIGNEAL